MFRVDVAAGNAPLARFVVAEDYAVRQRIFPVEAAQPCKELHSVLVRLAAIRLGRSLVLHSKSCAAGIANLPRFAHLKANVPIVSRRLPRVGHTLHLARGLQAGGGEVDGVGSNKAVDPRIGEACLVPLPDKDQRVRLADADGVEEEPPEGGSCDPPPVIEIRILRQILCLKSHLHPPPAAQRPTSADSRLPPVPPSRPP